MTLTVNCRTCGRSIDLAPQDAGHLVMCSACGASFLAPPLDPLQAPDAGAPTPRSPDIPVPPLDLPDLAALPSPPPRRASTPAVSLNPYRTPTASAGRQFIGIAAVLVVFLAFLGVGFFIVGLANRTGQTAPPVAVQALPAGASSPVVVPPDARPPTAAGDTPPVESSEAQRQLPAPLANVTWRPSLSLPPTSSTQPAPLWPVAVRVRPLPEAVRLQRGLVTDEQIGQAIRAGVDVLLAQFADGQLKSASPDARYAGINCLCVYALMQCGQAINDPRLDVRGKLMKSMLVKMKQLTPHPACETYTRAIRAAALAIHNRPEDRTAFRNEAQWLLRAARDGGYTYDGEGKSDPDNSNSQYGLLGVWSAAEVGIEVPQTYWAKVQKHWQRCQTPSGQWDYAATPYASGSLSMTVAGLTSMFVTHDYLEAPLFGKEVGRPPFSKSLAAGLAWLETGDNSVAIDASRYPGYILFGLERVGLASGFKYFGSHDWYPELAAALLGLTPPTLSIPRLDGLIASAKDPNEVIQPDDLIDTSFALLFLARGRHPILMNKLRFNGHWANRPRDVANLARFASRELERPLNWQVVPLGREWHDWMDSPILYIASHEPPNFSGADLVKLRQYVQAGGMIYTQADGDSPAFTEFVTDLGRKLFPHCDWKDVPPNHPLYSLNYRIDPPPPLRCLSNGSRILMLHSPQDLSQHWQLRAEKSKQASFELGVNLFVYAAGKTDFRNRLNSPYLPPLDREAPYVMRLARVQYPGNWDPEPHAFVRFSRWFEYQTGYRLQTPPVVIEWLRPGIYPVAHLTGSGPLSCSETQVAALRRYVEDGGVLVIDSCGGNPEFDQSIAATLQRAFAAGKLAGFQSDHPVLAGKSPGMDPLPTPRLRPGSQGLVPRLQIISAGKGHVIYSPLDLTTALLGTNTFGIQGYHPAYAQSFLKNVLLWAADAKAQ